MNNGYFLYNIAYKKRSDQMSDLLMDYADETEALRPLKMDVSFQFGRFICFSPSAQKDAVKPLQDLDKVQEEIKKQESNPGSQLDLQGVIDKLQNEKVSAPASQPQNQMTGAAPKSSTKKAASKKAPVKKTTVKKTSNKTK